MKIDTSVIVKFSSYEPSHFENHYLPQVKDSLPDFNPDRWVAIACLPKAAIRQAVFNRDAVSVVGNLIVGSTQSGRNLWTLGTAAAHSSVMASGIDHDIVQEATRDLNLRVGYIQDCWVILDMEKDPRKSEFATDRDAFGMVQWVILQEGVSVLPEDESVDMALETAKA